MIKSHTSTRRSFIRKLAVIAGFPTIVPSAVLGRTQLAPGNRIVVGIIGSGGQGRYHATKIHRLGEQAQLVAVCDVNQASIDKMRGNLTKLYGKDDVVSYNDFRELLVRQDIDAVTIAVPDHWHSLIAVAAANAGKHLFSEKPVAYTIAEGRAMVDAVKKAGVVFQHGTQQRSMAPYRLACELALNGRLGSLHSIRVGSPYGKRGGSTEKAPVPEGLNYDFWLGPAPYHDYTPGRCDGSGGGGWYHIRDYSGGWITAWGSHDLDIAQWGNGTDDTGPVEVEARAEYPDSGVYDTAWKWHAECRYANGRKIIYTSEDENPHGVRFEGDKGWVFVNREVIKAEPESLLKEEFGANELRVPVSDDHFGNFFDCIRSGATPVSSLEVSHRSTTVCHLVNIALACGGKLQWDPTAERCVNNDQANQLLNPKMRGPWKL